MNGRRVLILLLGMVGLYAHELRPAYLDLRETAPDVYAVLWKVPGTGSADLALIPAFPAPATVIGDIRMSLGEASLIRQWMISAPTLRGQSLGIDGLGDVAYDALVRAHFLDGREWVHRLRAQDGTVIIPQVPSAWATAQTYGILGVEHILLGPDHLLFVVALIFLVVHWRSLLLTITAFTVAHSLTLTACMLGWASIPSRPTEACIALSIVLVAAEIIHQRRGRTSLCIRHPWMAAFGFGLLHGFGFAGALSEIGLPQDHLPLALLSFNLGVEAGQLAVVAVVLLIALPVRRAAAHAKRFLDYPAYALGGLAACWTMQRMLG